jgi:hypothetical protein
MESVVLPAAGGAFIGKGTIGGGVIAFGAGGGGIIGTEGVGFAAAFVANPFDNC